MRNVKALESIARVQQRTPLFENPEITAMAAICEILEELEDDDARLRVMRWAFGRFNAEFKRPVPPTPAGQESAPTPRLVTTPAPVLVPVSAPGPVAVPAPAPASAAPTDPTRTPVPLVPAGPRATRQPPSTDDPSALDVRTVLTVAPELNVDKTVDHADFAGQISELHDLFPAQPKAAAVDWTSTLIP